MATDSTPRKQLVGKLAFGGPRPRVEDVVLTAIERKNADTSKTVVATTHVVLESDEFLLIDDDTAGGAVAVTLPQAAAREGRPLTVKKLGSTGNVTLTPDGSETIDGAGSLVISIQYDAPRIISDGSNWWII
jgi:hypothetical protein